MRATFRKESVVYQRTHALHGSPHPIHLAEPDSICPHSQQVFHIFRPILQIRVDFFRAIAYNETSSIERTNTRPMKKISVIFLAGLLSVGLTACQTSPTPDGDATQANVAYLGRYDCVSIAMDQLTMNPAGKWVQLHADGTMTTFLTEGSDEAEWTVSGENFTMTVAGKTVGTGTLAGGTLTLDLSGVEYTLTQEGTTPTSDSDPAATHATFNCYGGLYAVRYPTERYHEDPAGVSDLYTDDGVKGWITKLDTQERVDEWLAGFDAKAVDESIENYQTLDLTVAGYSARAIVYQDANGWHSEILVPFGKDLGTKTYPMYAAYLYFAGETYEGVWNEDIQSIVSSLSVSSH